MNLTPRRLFRAVAVTEAITWAGLLTGMYLEHVAGTTDLGVTVFGPVHGVAFIAYCLVTLLVAVDQRWPVRQAFVGLVAAVPPFFTVLFDAAARRRGLLDDRWHSHEQSEWALQRGVCWLLRHDRAALAVFAGAVAGLTGLALLAGPPAG